MKTSTSLPVLCGSEPGSFAEDTITRRLPEIARRVIAENTFDEPVNKRLSILADDLPQGLVRSLEDRQAADWQDWEQCLQPLMGRSWLEIPLFAAEMYFYRRVLEATGYFLPGPNSGFDPYLAQKKLGLEQAAAAIEKASILFELPPLERMRQLIDLSLWANQADLSLWPVKGQGGGMAQGGGGRAHLVADQSGNVLDYLGSIQSGRVDIILDNFGSELVFDLLIADALLEKSPDLSISLRVRPHPCFVSDIISPDIIWAIRWMNASSNEWLNRAGIHLERTLQSGRMKVVPHFYWGSPLLARSMPIEIHRELADSVLIISKGDINYRRWLDDARWEPATPLSTIIQLSRPLLLLRVIKSDTVAGLRPDQAQELERQDPAWMVNGNWGLIQFVEPGKPDDVSGAV